MKREQERLLWGLMVLSLVIAAVGMIRLPEEIPAHYGWDGTVDRMGSKYEMLLVPGVAWLMGGVMMLLARWVARRADEHAVRMVYVAGICGTAVFVVLEVVLLVMASRYGGEKPATDAARVMALLLGLMMMVLGNLMPKATKNPVFGLRTSWSMKNDRVWQKSQRFGGVCMMAAGLLSMVGCLFFREIACTMWMLGMLIGATVVACVGSWWIARRDEEEEQEEERS